MKTLITEIIFPMTLFFLIFTVKVPTCLLFSPTPAEMSKREKVNARLQFVSALLGVTWTPTEGC